MAEVKLALEEVAICLDCALVAGERLAMHQIIPSSNFEAMFEHIRSAQAAIDRALAAAEPAESTVIFLSAARRV